MLSKYTLFSNKDRNTRKGHFSGGISLYYKHFLKYKISIVNKNQYGILWVKLCKSLFDIGEDIYFCNTYILSPGSTVIDRNNFYFFEQIESDIEKYSPWVKS